MDHVGIKYAPPREEIDLEAGRGQVRVLNMISDRIRESEITGHEAVKGDPGRELVSLIIHKS